MEAVKAKFRLNGYRVVNTSINISPEVIHPETLDLQFDVNGVEDPERIGNYALSVTTTVKDREGNININLKIVGDFEYDQTMPRELVERLFVVNGPVILFPYIRSYVAAVTALSGIAPINIPTINFAKTSQMGKGKLTH